MEVAAGISHLMLLNLAHFELSKIKILNEAGRLTHERKECGFFWILNCLGIQIIHIGIKWEVRIQDFGQGGPEPKICSK